MPTYVQSNTRKTYQNSANPPVLDKVVFTIDHIHQGGPGLYSTYDVVKFLVGKQIPVTIFMQCSDPVNLCPADKRNAKKIYDLNPNLVTLGAHSLQPHSSQLAQRNNLSLIRNVITSITGTYTNIMSYHGHRAGPENGISYAGIHYARGIKSTSLAQRRNPLNTSVMGLSSVDSAFNYIRSRNIAGLSATLFVHSAEIRNGSRRKRVFDTLVKEVSNRRLQALHYHAAMRNDFSAGSPPPPTPDPTPTPPPIPPTCPPLSHFTNSTLRQNLRKGSRDGRSGITQVAELQRFLNELALGAGIADGIFGNNTKLAVIGYQILKSLSVDGVVGPNTRASINSFCR